MALENDLIRRLAARFPARWPVEVGIGDDGAVLRATSEERMVVVTDMLLDGVHFQIRECGGKQAGRKAVAVNLSDLAAMGCVPTAAFVSLAIPRETPPGFVDDLYSGIAELTDRYDFSLAGGDTNSWRGPFAINVCLIGRPYRNQAILRSTARPGDVVCVTGALGGSLRLGRHLTFEPRLDASAWLLTHLKVHAMMDISDGLSMDLPRMMEASGTGAIIEAAKVPVHPDVPSENAPAQRLSAAMNDGEDFELLVCLPEAEYEKIGECANDGRPELIPVGRVTTGGEVLLREPSGLLRPLQPGGWQHEFGG